jgi:O-antigen/teichoic acid export membrane protein
MGGATAQVVGNISNILFIPLALDLLGSTSFGLWMVVSSIIAYMGLSQFGLGSATAVMIAQSKTQEEQRNILFNSIRFLTIAGIGLLIFGVLMALKQDIWLNIFGVIPPKLLHEAMLCIGLMGFSFALRLPSVAFSSAFIGMQDVHLERFYTAILPPLISLLAVIVVKLTGGGLVELAIFTGGGQIVLSLLSGLHLIKRYPHYLYTKPTQNFDSKSQKLFLQSSGRYFLISLSALVVWGGDNLIISYFIGPDAVTAYSVTFKVFTAAYGIFMIINSGLWPLFGKAASEDDWNWVASTYKKAIVLMSFIGGGIWIAGVLFVKPLINLWTGPDGYGGELVVIALGGYGYLLALVNLHATLLTGMNFTKRMLWIGVAEAITNFIFSIFLLKWFGIGGVALGTFLSTLVTTFWLLPLEVRRSTYQKIKISWIIIIRQTLLTLFCLGLAIWVSREEMGVVYLLQSVCILTMYIFTSWMLLSQELKQNLYKQALRIIL